METHQRFYSSIQDLCTLSHLQVLASESEPKPPPFNVSNPRIYPINSRMPVLDVFQDFVELDLVKLKEESLKTKKPHNNLTKKESMALKKITDNKDFTGASCGQRGWSYYYERFPI